MIGEEKHKPQPVWSAERFLVRQSRRWPWLLLTAAGCCLLVFAGLIMAAENPPQNPTTTSATAAATTPAPAPAPLAALSPPAAVAPPVSTPEAPPVSAPESPPARRYMVQLSSMREEAQARAHFDRLARRHPALARMRARAQIRRADLDKRGIYYRLQLGPFARTRAQSLCAGLQEKGDACFVRRQ